MSSWWIVLFITVYWPFFVCYIFRREVCFVWYEGGYTCFLFAAICLSIIFHLFTLSLCLSLQLRCLLEVAYSWVLFLVHSPSLCPLIHEDTLNPLAFRVIIDRWGLSPEILCFAFAAFWHLCCFFFLCYCHSGVEVFGLFLSAFFFCFISLPRILKF